MKMINTRLLVVLMAVLLSACTQTFAVKPPIEKVSDYEYVNELSEEQRDNYDAETPVKAKLWHRKQLVDYKSGLPVWLGDETTKVTVLWNHLTDEVSVYSGHITGSMGMELAALIVYRTEGDEGEMVLQTSNGVKKPVVVMSQPFSQESSGRLAAKLAVQWLTGFSYGSGAALIRAHDSCDDCGNTTLINAGGNNAAVADVETVSGSNAGIDAAFRSGGISTE